MKYPFFAHYCRFEMCRTWIGPLNTSLGSFPAKPFCSVANGRLCHALKLSSWTQDCQPVVNGHATPAALSFAAAAATACHVAGAWFGSRGAFSNASLL